VKKMSENELSLDDLVPIETGQMSEEDKDKYDGTKTKIANIKIALDETKWGEDGKELPNGETRQVYVAIAETESLGSNSLGQPIIVKEKFPLKKHPVTGKWGPSLHEKSKAKKLFSKYKVNSFKECIGQSIVIVKKASPIHPDRTKLAFAL